MGGRLQFQGLEGGWRAAALAADSATLHRLPVRRVDVLCGLLQTNLYTPLMIPENQWRVINHVYINCVYQNLPNDAAAKCAEWVQARRFRNK